MTNTTFTQLTGHTLQVDPIEAAIAALADAALSDQLVCDGTCRGVASCTVAPVGLAAAA